MMDGEMVTPTDFQYGSAARIMNYAERKEEMSLKNRTGEEMSEEEKEVFETKSEIYEFQRHTVISPRSDDYTDKQMGELTRDSINEYFDGETVDYCYEVHEDEKNGKHAHVVLTGDIDDLYMNKSDIRDFNYVAKAQFRERNRSLERQLQRENGIERDRDRDQERERESEQTQQRTRQPRWMGNNEY